MGNYFLYSLYNELLFENHTNNLEDNEEDAVLFYNFCYDSVIVQNENDTYRNYYDYPFLIKQIKYFPFITNFIYNLTWACTRIVFFSIISLKVFPIFLVRIMYRNNSIFIHYRRV